MFLRWHPGAPTRIALFAALASATTGLFLAGFQVQGWTMPKAVAIPLFVLLGAMIVTSVSAIVVEAIRAFRSFLEHRSTTASWVESEEPGFLDYEPDGIRAFRRFTRELNKLARDTERLGRKTDRHTRRIQRTAGKSGRKKQRAANRSARDIERSAGYIEKRRDLLAAVVKDITRNTGGLILTADIESQEQIDEAKEFLRVLGDNRQAAEEAADHTDGYAQSVRFLEKQNATRKQRLACRRLAESLESVVRTLRKVESGLRKPSESLARRIKEAEKQGAQ